MNTTPTFQINLPKQEEAKDTAQIDYEKVFVGDDLVHYTLGIEDDRGVRYILKELRLPTPDGERWFCYFTKPGGLLYNTHDKSSRLFETDKQAVDDAISKGRKKIYAFEDSRSAILWAFRA